MSNDLAAFQLATEDICYHNPCRYRELAILDHYKQDVWLLAILGDHSLEYKTSINYHKMRYASRLSIPSRQRMSCVLFQMRRG